MSQISQGLNYLVEGTPWEDSCFPGVMKGEFSIFFPQQIEILQVYFPKIQILQTLYTSVY